MRGTGVTQILLKGAGNTGHGTVLEFVEALPFIPDTFLKVLKAIDQEEFQPGQVLGGFVDSYHNLFYLIALRFDGLQLRVLCPGATEDAGEHPENDNQSDISQRARQVF